MRSNPYITQKELAAKCGLTEDGVYYVVSKLRKSGVVKRVGGRKLGYWEVLYLLQDGIGDAYRTPHRGYRMEALPPIGRRLAPIGERRI